MGQRNKFPFLAFVVFFLVLSIVSAAVFTPQGDIDLRYAYQIKNGSNISANNISATNLSGINIWQNGSAVLDIRNYSALASTQANDLNTSNISLFLQVPNISLFLQTANISPFLDIRYLQATNTSLALTQLPGFFSGNCSANQFFAGVDAAGDFVCNPPVTTNVTGSTSIIVNSTFGVSSNETYLNTYWMNTSVFQPLLGVNNTASAPIALTDQLISFLPNELTAVGVLTNLTVSGAVNLSLNWTKLQNYPSGCSAGQGVQNLSDAPDCFVPQLIFDTSPILAANLNANSQKITSLNNVTFSNTGSISSNTTCTIIRGSTSQLEVC